MAELEFNIARLQQCLDVTVGTPSVGDVVKVTSTSPLEFELGPGGGGTGTVNYVDGNDPISVNNVDPAYPIINIAIADKAQAGVVNDAPQEWWGVKTFDSLPVSSQDPTDPEQLTTKKYVDTFAAGLQVKAAVRAATLVPGTLASSFENGDIIDGVTLTTGDRILIKNQTNAVENGIFTVNASGAPTRATDYDQAGEANAGTFTTVTEGGQKNTQWVQVNTGTPVPGTNALNFSRLNISGNVNTIQSPNLTHGTGGTLTGAVKLDSTDIYYSGYSGSNLKTVVDSKAPIASPNFTGIPKTPNAAIGTNNTQIANTAFVTGSLANKQNYSASLTSLAGLTYVPLGGFPRLSGINTWTLDTTAYATQAALTAGLASKLDVTTAAATYAPIASPTFTGSPTVSGPVITPPTDSSDKIATTAFVQSALASNTGVSIKVSLTSAQILGAFSSPVTLVPAPGVGKAVRLLAITGRLNYGSVQYTGGGSNSIIYPTSLLFTGQQVVIPSTNFVNSIGNKITTFILTAPGNVSNVVENDSLSFRTMGTAYANGDSTIDFYITYQIITL